MKAYVKPEAQIIALEGNDVICASPADVIIIPVNSSGRHALLDWDLKDWSREWPDDETKGIKG